MGTAIDSVSGKGFYVYVSDEALCKFILAHSATVQRFEKGIEILEYIKSAAKADIENIKERYYDYACRNSNSEGLYGLICDVMSEETGINFQYYVGDSEGDFDDCIMYVPTYPWKLNKIERELTEEKLDNILKKYIGELGGQLQVDYIQLVYEC